MRWTLAIGLLAAICGSGYLAANTDSYVECNNTRAAGYFEETRPTLSEKIGTFVVCEQRAFDVDTDQTLMVLAIIGGITFLFGISFLSKTSSPDSKNARDVNENTSRDQSPIFGHKPRDNTTNMVNPPSIIGRSVLMKGALQSAGDFQIEGNIEGDIQCSNVVIAETAQVRGDIFADRVMIRGRFSGTVRANEVILSAGSQVEGVIWQKSLQIENGARFTGDCRHSENPHADLAIGTTILKHEQSPMISSQRIDDSKVAE